jgi:hypothetical protein
MCGRCSRWQYPWIADFSASPTKCADFIVIRFAFTALQSALTIRANSLFVGVQYTVTVTIAQGMASASFVPESSSTFLTPICVRSLCAELMCRLCAFLVPGLSRSGFFCLIFGHRALNSTLLRCLLTVERSFLAAGTPRAQSASVVVFAVPAASWGSPVVVRVRRHTRRSVHRYCISPL